MLSNSHKFAVFDIDGTLYRGNLTWDFFNVLIRENKIPSSNLEKLESYYIAHDNRIDDRAYSEYDKNLIEIFCDSLKTIDDMDSYWLIGNQVAANNNSRLYKYTRELLNQLRSDGYLLVAITNSVGAVARPFATSLGFDITIANDEIIDDKNSGISDWSIYTRGTDKGLILASLIAKNKLILTDSYAIGDTRADATMLALVEHPIAFNPEKDLQKTAI